MLRFKKYELSYKYVNRLNYHKNQYISYETISFFKENDKNKILLLYDGGGIGDKIMFSRFIYNLCTSHNDNNIKFLVPINLFWFFNEIFKQLPNITIISNATPSLIQPYDYHCSF